VALDSTGSPVRPAIIWSDSRSEAEVRRWSETIGSARVEQITGMPIATGMLGVSLSWVQHEQPDVYRRIAHVFSPKDYIRFRLTDAVATEPTDAAGGLLFDIRHGVASDEIADAVGL
ncbi:xylulokinase, partial [Pseudomonas sp. BGM005]|nr:xylulokinase [Pseudomonas sp. BG5]